MRAPRLTRHLLRLDDGHRVGVAVAGRGLPLVVVHGYTAEGILYAQTLSRLVSMGCKVIAIDIAGHGLTAGLARPGSDLGSYAHLLVRAIEALGVRRAVLCGHSLGGRLVTEVAANRPDLALGVIAVNAIVGDTWDRLVDVLRLAPAMLVPLGGALVVDSLATLPVLSDPRQAAKLGRLAIPTLVSHAVRPFRLVGPGVSILRSRGSGWMLDRLADEHVPFVAVHGDRDVPIPLATAHAAARRARGQAVEIHGAGHSWLLKDPETLPVVMGRLFAGPVGDAVRADLAGRGLDPDRAGVEEVETALHEPAAWVLGVSPMRHRRLSGARPAWWPEPSEATDVRPRTRYTWTVVDHRR